MTSLFTSVFSFALRALLTGAALFLFAVALPESVYNSTVKSTDLARAAVRGFLMARQAARNAERGRK